MAPTKAQGSVLISAALGSGLQGEQTLRFSPELFLPFLTDLRPNFILQGNRPFKRASESTFAQDLSSSYLN